MGLGALIDQTESELKRAIFIWRVDEAPVVLRPSGVASSDFVVVCPPEKRDEALEIALLLAGGNRLGVTGGRIRKIWLGREWCLLHASDPRVEYD